MFQSGAKQTLSMLDVVKFQDGTDLDPTNSLSRFLPTEKRAQATQQPDKDMSPSLMLLLFLINFE